MALAGRRIGSSWLARCPSHDDREPSLAIRDGGDGRVLVHCHAGCSKAQVMTALRRRGLWDEVRLPREFRAASAPTSFKNDTKRRTQDAIRIWEAGRIATGTLVETYLASRNLRGPVSGCLRFHPNLRHPDGGVWPAMVALVVDVDDQPIGIHRTFLATDGLAKAPVASAKMVLGPTRGGAVRFGPAAETLMVSEGIETALSVMQSTGLPAWAALSTSGMKALVLPYVVKEVVILADADAPGESAALNSATRWVSEGRKVRIARPTKGCNDFNDLLCLCAGRRTGA